MVARSRPFELLSPGFVAVREELGTSSGLTRSGYSPPAPFTTVEVSVGDAPGSVLAGLSAENGDHLLGFHVRPPSARPAATDPAHCTTGGQVQTCRMRQLWT